jgi:hypothetical protein
MVSGMTYQPTPGQAPPPPMQPPSQQPYPPQPGFAAPPPPAAGYPPQPLGYQPSYMTGVRCPKCGDPRSKPVSFTWWGGVIGPKILSHVKCLSCGSAYNGKTGRYNTTGIVIYTLVVLGIVLIGMVALAFSQR